MKTEFLKGLGLEQEVIDKIMAENGKDIEKHKVEAETAKASVTQLTTQLTERDTQLEALKKVDAEGLQAKITELQAANTEAQKKHEADIKAERLNFALESRLIKEGAVNTKAVRALLDASKVSLDGENLVGLDEQLKALKESEKWAFGEAQPGSTGMQQKNPPNPDPLATMRAAMGLPDNNKKE